MGVGPDAGVDLDDLRQKLETHKPYNIIGTFSACSNVTGILVDTDQISEIIHQYNGVVIWDYASGGKVLYAFGRTTTFPHKNKFHHLMMCL